MFEVGNYGIYEFVSFFVAICTTILWYQAYCNRLLQFLQDILHLFQPFMSNLPLVGAEGAGFAVIEDGIFQVLTMKPEC